MTDDDKRQAQGPEPLVFRLEPLTPAAADESEEPGTSIPGLGPQVAAAAREKRSG